MPARAGDIVRDEAFGGVLLDAQGRVCLVRPVGRGVWALPKGHLDPGETKTEAALREVREETGFDAELSEYLGQISYTFLETRSKEPVTVAKTVDFWAMVRVGDEARGHDHEMEALAWVDLEKVPGRLSYPTERGLVESKLERLRELASEHFGADPKAEPTETR